MTKMMMTVVTVALAMKVKTGFYLFGPHFDLYQSLNRLPI